MRGLRVLMDNKLNFKAQRSKVIDKSNQKAGWVLRIFKSHQVDFMRILFKSLIQPHLDYCSIIWAPVSNKGIYLLWRALCEHIKRKHMILLT